MKKVFAVTAAILALPFALSAQSVTSISPSFADPDPASVTVDNSDADNVKACWGNLAGAGCPLIGNGSSGYNFARAGVPINDVTFSLGMFTHDNFEIFPPFLNSIDLNVDFDVANLGPVMAQWNISHDETTNESPCADPGSVSVCDDVVSLNWYGGQSAFNFDDGINNYSLEILGWGADAASATLSFDFVTQEFASTSTQLWATIVQGAEVPEPTSLALMGLGLAGLAAAARRRRNA